MPSGSNPSPQGKKQTRGERNKMKKMHREKKRRRHKPIDSIQSRTIPVSHNFDFLSTGRAAFVGKNHIHSYSNEQNYLYIGLNSSWDQTSITVISKKSPYLVLLPVTAAVAVRKKVYLVTFHRAFIVSHCKFLYLSD